MQKRLFWLKIVDPMQMDLIHPKTLEIQFAKEMVSESRTHFVGKDTSEQ